MSDVTAARLTGALLYRTVVQQRRAVLLTPLALTLLLAVLTAVVVAHPAALTGPTREALARTAAAHFPAVSALNGRALVLAFLLVQLPYLCGVLASVGAARVTQTLMRAELERGGLESLFGLPLPPSEVVRALVITATAVTLLCWGSVAVGGLAVMGGALAALGLNADGLYPFLAGSTLAALSCTLWSVLATAGLSLRYPGAMGVQGGQVGPLAQLIAIAPALACFLGISLIPGADLWLFAITSVIGSVLALAILAGLIAKGMDVSSVLMSS